jgi:hypothetical protein
MLSEVKLATDVKKDHKFDNAEVGKTAGHTKGFKYLGAVKGHDVYHRPRAENNHDYVMTNENDRKIHTHLNLDKKKSGAHHVNFVQSNGKGPGVHHLYHHLITKHNIMMTSNHQSEGGARIWARLQRMRGVHVHGIDSKGRGHHVDLSDTSNTHVNPNEPYMTKSKAEEKHLRSIMALRLVAHKS